MNCSNTSTARKPRQGGGRLVSGVADGLHAGIEKRCGKQPHRGVVLALACLYISRQTKLHERGMFMADQTFSFDQPGTELRKEGQVVGTTDRVYVVAGPSVRFDEVLVRGDLSGELQYNGKKLRVVRIDTTIGLMVDQQGPRGPIWKGVDCEVAA
jgi:hypothetical protein